MIYVLALLIMSNVFGYTGVLVSQACSDVVTALIAAVIMLKIMKKLTNKMNKYTLQEEIKKADSFTMSVFLQF